MPRRLRANITPDRDREYFTVFSRSGIGRSFEVHTIHISCKSNPFIERRHPYGGIIIYGRNGCGDWYTANGTHCKSGYVVITQTDTEEFQELQKKWPNERGKVHGVIYRQAFGESCKDVNVVGEGFGIMKGVFQTTSGAFNPSHDDDYHDDCWEMHPDSTKCVKKVVEWWKTAGSNFLACQNHAVKSLLSSKD